MGEHLDWIDVITPEEEESFKKSADKMFAEYDARQGGQPWAFADFMRDVRAAAVEEKRIKEGEEDDDDMQMR